MIGEFQIAGCRPVGLTFLQDVAAELDDLAWTVRSGRTRMDDGTIYSCERSRVSMTGAICGNNGETLLVAFAAFARQRGSLNDFRFIRELARINNSEIVSPIIFPSLVVVPIDSRVMPSWTVSFLTRVLWVLHDHVATAEFRDRYR